MLSYPKFVTDHLYLLSFDFYGIGYSCFNFSKTTICGSQSTPIQDDCTAKLGAQLAVCYVYLYYFDIFVIKYQ